MFFFQASIDGGFAPVITVGVYTALSRPPAAGYRGWALAKNGGSKEKKRKKGREGVVGNLLQGPGG